VKLYNGSCHCGAVKFSFSHEEISEGLRCNCSICVRKGALMTSFVLAADEITIDVQNDALATYEFASGISPNITSAAIAVFIRFTRPCASLAITV